MKPFDERLSKELIELEPKLVSYLKTPSEPTNAIIAHIINSGGKRIRPGLFLTCCDLLDYQAEHRHTIAAVCEYIHTASLLHDDVIDHSKERRGRPTVSSVWGDETAVLAGDLIYSAACRLMVKTGSLELIDAFAECIRFMSESELYQLQLLWNIETKVEEYLKVVEGKTAFLFAVACQTPSFLSKHSGSDHKLLSESLFQFGLSLGFAFQIADDCLDYSYDSSTLGKPAVSDIYEGKVTLPLILALQTASKTERDVIAETLAGELPKTEMNQSRIQDIVVSRGGVSQALTFAEKRTSDALAVLEKIASDEKNFEFLSHKALTELRQMPQFIMARKN